MDVVRLRQAEYFTPEHFFYPARCFTVIPHASFRPENGALTGVAGFRTVRNCAARDRVVSSQEGERRVTVADRNQKSRRNSWLHPPSDRTGAVWPLAYDLGRDVGRPVWWTRLGLGLAGPALALAMGLGMPDMSRPLDDRDDHVTAMISQAQAHVDESALAARDLAAHDGETLQVVAPAVVAETMPAPHPPLLAALSPAPETAAPRAVRHILRRNETLIEALINAGSDRRDAYAAANALAGAIDTRRLRPGLELVLELAEGASAAPLSSVSLRIGFDRRVTARRAANAETGAFTVGEDTLPARRVLDHRAGEISDSLYLAARRTGVPTDILIDMIRLFSFNVDFQRQIRPGDSFELIYERRIAEADGRIENGRILYARMTLRGEEMAFYRFEDADGEVDYFDRDGKSARKALMKTPLDGARLTSHFGPRRHPVLGYVRTHQGVDFGAPTGTPVYAAGDGVVERASRYGSYGNYIRIRHNSTEYKTAYAHLSGYARGIRAGARVKQGQVIGYVGATGRVTGAHLHYEVYRGEARVNPLRLDLPSGRKLDGPAREAFLQQAESLDSDRKALAHATRIALDPGNADLLLADSAPAPAP